MKRIDYSQLRPGDIIGTTNTFSALGLLARSTNAGFQRILDPSVASHVGVVCQEHDLLYIMEMTGKGISQNDLNQYEHGPFGNHIVFVARPLRFGDVDGDVDKMNQWLLESHMRHVKYDWRGLCEFWGICNDDRRRWICSELVREMLRACNVWYPHAWEVKASPFDVQEYFGRSKIRWWL
jgi:hypothetical protein